MADWHDLRPDDRFVKQYRESGAWRDATPAADLRHWAATTPDAVAINAWRADSGIRRLTYREYEDQVARQWSPDAASRAESA